MPAGRKPILCYVTDRRAIESTHVSPAGDAVLGEIKADPKHPLIETIRNAARAGVDWIQIREKDMAARAMVELARLAVADTRTTGAGILVNDRLDVALAAGASGVHLGESSLDVETVADWRRSAENVEFQIGVSCHSVEAACAAERRGADYIFFGPVFATPSKAAFGPPQGIGRLRDVCNSVRIPVLAIGGVTIENAASGIAAGAAGIAAIRLFQESQNLPALVAQIRGM